MRRMTRFVSLGLLSLALLAAPTASFACEAQAAEKTADAKTTTAMPACSEDGKCCGAPECGGKAAATDGAAAAGECPCQKARKAAEAAQPAN